jgi:hypothetical protein
MPGVLRRATEESTSRLAEHGGHKRDIWNSYSSMTSPYDGWRDQRMEAGELKSAMGNGDGDGFEDITSAVK